MVSSLNLCFVLRLWIIQVVGANACLSDLDEAHIWQLLELYTCSSVKMFLLICGAVNSFPMPGTELLSLSVPRNVSPLNLMDISNY